MSAAPVVSRLAFLSPHEADVAGVSPLRHVPGAAFTDVSHLGKLEVRGDVTRLDAISLGPGRALVVLAGDVRVERDRLVDEGYLVYDMTAALAALEVEGEDGARPRGAARDRVDRARNHGVDRAA